MGCRGLEKSANTWGQLIQDPPEAAKRIHVPSYEEILARIKSRYPRGKRRPLDLEMARLQATYDIVMSKTSFVRELTRLLDSLHPFYWSLIEIDFNRKRISEALWCISRARRIAPRLLEKYKVLLLAAEDRRELARVSREARGRILSLFKKCRKDFEYLRNLVVFIQHLPSVDASAPTIIVAGAPSTGKSTLVRSVSRSQTRIAAYPFTTTTIHIGHFTLNINKNDIKIQIIDTPGLLDRDPSEMNPVERRAVAALRELEGAVLFLVDPSPQAYMDLERQFNLLNIIRNNYLKNKIIYIGINKVDISEESAVAEAERRAMELAEANIVEAVYRLVATSRDSALGVVSAIARRIVSRGE